MAVPSRRQELTGKRGEFVCSSTPNLTGNWGVFKSARDDDDFEHHNSMKDVTSSVAVTSGEKGILMTGSKSGGLSKGVSFCPIVSEISWKETNISDGDEIVDDRSVNSDEFDPIEMPGKLFNFRGDSEIT